MDETKRETTTKTSQQKTKQTASSSSSSPNNPLDQETPPPPPPQPPQSRPLIHHQQQPFLSSQLYNPETLTATVITSKRPRYGGSTAASDPQWKNLPLPSPSTSPDVQKKQTQLTVFTTDTAANPISPTTNPTASSETAGSSPSNSAKPETEPFQNQQLRKGKYVSPVWKPNEMLWLARAWKSQYHGRPIPGPGEYLESGRPGTRGKTRAEKDREVAEFLNRHGVNRDAKTAGTKWDNMLGEFRKVYEWERCGERERYGKSYFRLSPYERKVFRLPASFDEEVFEELAQFMGPRMRAAGGGGRGGAVMAVGDLDGGRRLLPPPLPPLREDEPTLITSGRGKQQALMTTIGDHQQLPYPHNITRGLSLIPCGHDYPSYDALTTGPSSSSSSSYKDLRRIGKVRMVWEESVSLWAEENETQRGRVRVRGSSFLNAEELTFLDESMVACAMECFEEGPLQGFSLDRFISGQQVKVFGRRKSTLTSSSSSGLAERTQMPSAEPLTRPIPTWEFQDPTEHFLTSLRVPPTTLPSLFELSWHLQEPPPEDLRFPLRKDVYRDLPPGKELFFTTSSTELLDCRTITYKILSPIIATNSGSVVSSRDSLIPTWDDCVNRVVSEFCPAELRIVRKPSSGSAEWDQDQWPNVTGFVENLCLWRGEETDEVKEGQTDPCALIVQNLFWTYGDVPYILGYYAIGYNVTFCALSRSNDRVIRTDLYSFDASSPTERIKALVPCYRLAGLLPLLAEHCNNNVTDSDMFLCYSDFGQVELSDLVVEMSPHTVTKLYKSKRKWTAVKEVYDFLDHRVPHTEYLYGADEKDLSLTFKPRGVKVKPKSVDQLVEALKCVTKALVALHDLSFMHRDLSWEKVVRKPTVDGDRSSAAAEWFVCGFEEAVSAPKIYPRAVEESGKHAPPEMGRGLHGVKVDVWGIGYLVKTCGISNVPKMLRELENKCLEPNPELRPTAADCYHHLLQLQSATSPAY